MKVKRYEDDVELRHRQVSSLRLDASDLEAIKKLKDRAQGEQFVRQFEASCVKLEEFVRAVEKEMKDRAALVELLEQSELFYDAQHGEAKIVANVRLRPLSLSPSSLESSSLFSGVQKLWGESQSSETSLGRAVRDAACHAHKSPIGCSLTGGHPPSPAGLHGGR